MNRKSWLTLTLCGVVTVLSVGCSTDFSSCEARRACAAGGGAGEAGTRGESMGEAGGDQLGNGEGGSGEGGAGEGGAGGDGGADPVLFSACSVKGEFACVGHANAQRLACDGKQWQAGTTCAANQLCNSTDGTCAAIVTECAAAEPGGVVCRGDTLLTCGADLVSASEGEACPGLCNFGTCQPPTCGDEKKQPGEDCDDDDAAASGACVKCKTGTCGDGAVYTANQEQCDDGNKVSGDGCSATCRAEAVELALGNNVTCARSSTGLVKCWGGNQSGQLGLGDMTSRGHTLNTVPSKLLAIDLGTARKATAISARGSSVCALLDGGDVKCWGNNSAGQLGTNDKDHRGDELGEMGEALKPIRLGVGMKASAVSSADSHTCVVLSAGSVKCWGAEQTGQLGQDNRAEVLSPEHLTPIKLARPAKAVSASNFLASGKGGYYGGSTCALLDDERVQCWGYGPAVPLASSADLNGSGGIGDFEGEMSGLLPLTLGGGRPAKSIIAGTVSAAVLDDGSLRLWGTGPQLGQPSLGSSQVGLTPADLAALPAVQLGAKKVKSIAVGGTHACAVLDDGALKCWGGAGYGQLGLGSPSPTDAAPKDIASVDLGGRGALQVATGAQHTCAILDNGAVKCWGYNGTGQLGLGDTSNRGDTGGKLSADTTVDLSF